MGCHTWFYRPIKENEVPADTCEYSDLMFGDDRFTDVDTPHDIFRIGNYPEIYLTSLSESLNFIEQNKEKIYFNDNWEEKLKEFWDKNPNGVIEFG